MGYREVERGTGWVSLGDGTFYITLVQIEERFGPGATTARASA